MPTPRTSTLFHFTSSRNSLEAILHNGFWPRYCLEDNEWLAGEIYYIAYPMVCFCDIPISRLEEHTDKYGGYGIGLSHDWGQRSGLNPVLYVTEGGKPKNAIRQLLTTHDAKEGSDEEFAAIDLVSFTKPHTGVTLKNGKNEVIEYYEECEWRYVPESKLLKEAGILSKEEFDDEKQRDAANQKIKEKGMLKFSPSDIRYILVPELADIPPMYDFINAQLSHYPLADLKILTTRIFALSDLREDI